MVGMSLLHPEPAPHLDVLLLVCRAMVLNLPTGVTFNMVLHVVVTLSIKLFHFYILTVI